MEELQVSKTLIERFTGGKMPSGNRRKFLKNAGMATAIGAAIVTIGCKKDDDMDPIATTVDLGSGDVGILNYAYALEQLEAAFYIQAVATPYSGIPASELELLTEIRDHEIIHRDFFKAALGAGAIPNLEVNFASIDFTSRASVLGTAKVFEDTGVQAYNGAGKLIKDAGYLLLAGKIVSVEARHAAAIRDLLMPLSTSFAGDDLIDNNGLDKAIKPADILAAVSGFIKTKVSGANLPS
jgi:hypothetical protein